MRDYKAEVKNRIQFIRNCLDSSGAKGIVYGNSGGKDSALVGILCKMACDNTVGLIMPCRTKRNYDQDMNDALEVAKKYNIEVRTVDLKNVYEELESAIKKTTVPTDLALANIAPRLRMTTLYAVAASENRLVAGTGNRSESYMGYFTKWGDGACDFNPIADLTVTEIYEFLRYLDAPYPILEKAPSAGLFDDQTDEAEMGISYKVIDKFLMEGEVSDKERLIIEKFHRNSEHKRRMPIIYGGQE